MHIHIRMTCIYIYIYTHTYCKYIYICLYIYLHVYVDIQIARITHSHFLHSTRHWPHHDSVCTKLVLINYRLLVKSRFVACHPLPPCCPVPVETQWQFLTPETRRKLVAWPCHLDLLAVDASHNSEIFRTCFFFYRSISGISSIVSLPIDRFWCHMPSVDHQRVPQIPELDLKFRRKHWMTGGFKRQNRQYVPPQKVDT